MRFSDTWTNFWERSRLNAASGVFSLATFVLWLTRRMYRARLLIFSDLRYAFRVSKAFRRLGWRLIIMKHHKGDYLGRQLTPAFADESDVSIALTEIHHRNNT